MKSKKMTMALASAAIIVTMATTVFAAQSFSRPGPANNARFNQAASGETQTAELPERTPGFPGGNMANLTEEQKAEMEAKKAEMEAERAEMAADRTAREETWNALTDAQKEALYVLRDKAIDADIEAVDQYLAYGLITEEEAVTMKEKLEKSKTEMRESGGMPFLGGGGFQGGHPKGDPQGGGRGGFKGNAPAPAPQSGASSASAASL